MESTLLLWKKSTEIEDGSVETRFYLPKPGMVADSGLLNNHIIAYLELEDDVWIPVA